MFNEVFIGIETPSVEALRETHKSQNLKTDMQQGIRKIQRYGMGVIVWSPLDGGWLTGRYRKPEDLDPKSRVARTLGRRGGRFDPESALHREKFALVDELSKLADGAGLSLTHLAMAFTMEHPAITSAIIGPRTESQLDDLLELAAGGIETIVAAQRALLADAPAPRSLER